MKKITFGVKEVEVEITIPSRHFLSGIRGVSIPFLLRAYLRGIKPVRPDPARGRQGKEV
jgi:hypothetical protein